MALDRNHGARVFQGEDPVLVQFVATSVIGLLIAVDPDDLPAGAALNTPILILRASDASAMPDVVREELDTVFDQVTTQVVLVLIDEGADAAALTANAVGDRTQKTGIHAFSKAPSMGMPEPKLLAAPGLTTAAAPDGIASVAVTVAGTGYTEEGTTVTVAGATTGQGAVLRPVIGAGGAITGIVVEKPGYGYDGTPTVTITGDGEDAAATATIGQVLNAVIAEGQGVAEATRGMFYADGPDGTAAQAVAARQLIGSRFVSFSDPRVLKSIDGAPTPKSSSTLFAAVQAKMDRQRGSHWPASNQLVNGVQGTNRPVDTATEANFLNSNGVNTIINRGDGFRLWGPLTCAIGTVWEFVNVVRVANLVNESIETSFVQFNDRPMTLANLDLMVMAGRGALRRLQNDGVLLAGSSFDLDREALEPEDGAQGIVKFAMRYEPPAPIYDIRITAYRNITIAYELLFDSVTGQVSTGDLIQ